MAVTTINVAHLDGIDLGTSPSFLDGDNLTGALAALLKSPGEKGVSSVSVLTSSSDNVSVAGGTVVFSGTSGTIGADINGVAVTFASTGGDVTDGTAMVAAVAASTNPAVDGVVAASNVAAIVTIAAPAVGDSVTVSGCTFVAVAEGTPNLLPGQFALGANGNLTAISLAGAIRANQKLSAVVTCGALSNLVVIWMNDVTKVYPVFSNNSTTLAVTSVAATAYCLIRAYQPGPLGNAVTLVASGTGVTTAGLSNGRLTGGDSYSAIHSTTF